MFQTVPLLYQRYRLIAFAVNVAVLLAGLVDWLYTGLGPRSLIEASENLRFLIFALAAFSLIGLDVWGVGATSFTKPVKANYTPFLIRFLLVIGACTLVDLSYSQLLFLPVLLYSYLAVNKRLSYVLAILAVATLLGFRLSNFSGMGELPPAGPLPRPRPGDFSPSGFPPSVFPTGGVPSPENGGFRTNVTRRNGRLMDESMGALITLFFTLLLARAMSQATQAQQNLTGLLASLEASHKQLKQYSAQVADLAATEERNRLARDIHDSLGHHLAAINIQLEKANAYRKRDPSRAHEAVNHAQRTVQDALKDVRESVSSLRQGSETFLFEKSLNDLLNRMRHSELEIMLSITGDSASYSRLKLLTLYRVIQEGLTNVHKHANASQVKISLVFSDQHARLDLIDNGAGFDVAAWKLRKNKQATQGLVGLQERLSLVGGTLDISSHAHSTTLTIGIPHSSDQVGSTTATTP